LRNELPNPIACSKPIRSREMATVEQVLEAINGGFAIGEIADGGGDIV